MSFPEGMTEKQIQEKLNEKVKEIRSKSKNPPPLKLEVKWDPANVEIVKKVHGVDCTSDLVEIFVEEVMFETVAYLCHYGVNKKNAIRGLDKVNINRVKGIVKRMI